jgi:hypothetical protein
LDPSFSFPLSDAGVEDAPEQPSNTPRDKTIARSIRMDILLESERDAGLFT